MEIRFSSGLAVTAAVLGITIQALSPIEAQESVADLIVMKEQLGSNGAASYLDARELANRPEFSTGELGDRALRVVEFYADRLRLRAPRQQLNVGRVNRDIAGNSHVRLHQRSGRLPVEGAGLIVHFSRDGFPSSVTGTVVPDADTVPSSPILSRSEARQIALGAVAQADSGGLRASAVTLLIYNDGLPRGRAGESQLAWKVTVVGAGVREFVYVSAIDGSVIDLFSGVHSARNRLTFDMHGTTNYAAATLERTEGAPPAGDADVDDAHDFAGDAYDFYFNAYGRDSLDDAGFDLLSYTHYFSPNVCPNAFWDGLRMTYCDGFPTDDVTAHELTHGVTEFTANLVYRNQPGALNESLSDIFGEVVDQINGAGDDSPAVKWLLGEDLPIIGAIRDMSNPPAFGDPDRVTSPLYACGPSDSGGVHTNSGVPNKNFYLLTEGGVFNGRWIRGMGLTKAAAIHYQALTNYLSVNTQFPGYFISLWRSCLDLVGVNLNDPITGTPSGEVLTLWECIDVLRAGVAVEFLSPACV